MSWLPAVSCRSLLGNDHVNEKERKRRTNQGSYPVWRGKLARLVKRGKDDSKNQWVIIAFIALFFCSQ